MLIDTHSHFNFEDFDKDRDKVIKECLKNNIWIINIGTDYQTSKKAVKIAKKYKKGIFAAIGLHPINTKEKFDYQRYKILAKSKEVVAIGEIGLDYWSKPKTKRKLELFKEKQKEIFLKQLELAKELNLPVIFHCRMAHDDLIEILKSQILNYKLRGVIHSFTGNWWQAQKFLEMNFYLGFNGLIFKLKLDEVIKKTPLDKILIETDCPFLPPPDFKKERNDPLSLKYIVKKIAKIKNKNFKEIAKATTKNAKELFSI
jgi:TatD DNase family protein